MWHSPVLKIRKFGDFISDDLKYSVAQIIIEQIKVLCIKIKLVRNFKRRFNSSCIVERLFSTPKLNWEPSREPE